MSAAAASAAGAGGTAQAFTGSSAAELAAWLQRGGIDTARYGQAAAKSVDQLW